MNPKCQPNGYHFEWNTFVLPFKIIVMIRFKMLEESLLMSSNMSTQYLVTKSSFVSKLIDRKHQSVVNCVVASHCGSIKCSSGLSPKINIFNTKWLCTCQCVWVSLINDNNIDYCSLYPPVTITQRLFTASIQREASAPMVKSQFIPSRIIKSCSRPRGDSVWQDTQTLSSTSITFLDHRPWIQILSFLKQVGLPFPMWKKKPTTQLLFLNNNNSPQSVQYKQSQTGVHSFEVFKSRHIKFRHELTTNRPLFMVQPHLF